RALVVDLDQAVGDVLAAAGPGVAHPAEQLEQLAEMERLAAVDHVERASELVGLPAVLGGGDVAGRVEGGAVAGAEEDRGFFVGQLDDEGALAVLGEAGGGELAEDPRHVWLVGGFAAHLVVLDPEDLVDGLELGPRDVAEALPEGARGRIAVFELL